MKQTLEFKSGTTLLAAPCADITIYWRGSAYLRAQALIRCYAHAMQGLQKHIKWYETETTGEMRRVNAATFDLLPHWLSHASAKRGIMALLLESAEDPDASSDMAFSIFCDEEAEQPMGFLRVVMPALWMEQHPEQFLRTTLDLVTGLDFESGHAGYAINWEPRGEDADTVEKHLRRVAKSYQGVDIAEPNTTLIALQESTAPALKCANWITLLGSPLAEELEPSLRAASAGWNTARLEPFTTGIALVAGAAPMKGPRDGPDEMQAYREVGRAVAARRVVEHAPLFMDDDEATYDWLARFDS